MKHRTFLVLWNYKKRIFQSTGVLNLSQMFKFKDLHCLSHFPFSFTFCYVYKDKSQIPFQIGLTKDHPFFSFDFFRFLYINPVYPQFERVKRTTREEKKNYIFPEIHFPSLLEKECVDLPCLFLGKHWQGCFPSPPRL